ncbi:hypothetical protein DKT77_17195 [Meridianimarinicoccus roseus]|jgi:hypothetical protein|uniref:Bacterial CdiA-CT RNAse A domain-containing protein n=1 Tax=Meridianimarinicoccus roseus TaxID=2072018 RepID=A0A2V2L7U7_9RHOB|nr:hypothetical protein [Meridianimarinicoccus roseus]PWR01440.1 hypothetical protein DKT77_17195 [Meridianimarinicoccus roseus]
MPVQKIYTKAEVVAAIETANGQYFDRLVRRLQEGGAASAEVALNGAPDVPADADPEADASASRAAQAARRGTGIGHAYRHVHGLAPPGKSAFDDRETLYLAVRHLLNAPRGQRRLAALDAAVPEGGLSGFRGGQVITATLSGPVSALVLYGRTQDGAHRKIKKALCIVQKLTDSHLWVHTAYPLSFH